MPTSVMLTFLYAAYFAALLAIYIYGVSPVFFCMGFTTSFKIENCAISALMLSIAIPFLRPNGLPSGFFLNVAASIVLVPTLVIYTGAGLPHRFALITLAAFIIVAITAKLTRTRPVKLPAIGSTSLIAAFLFISVAIILAMIIFGSARFLNFNLAAVYDIRKEAAESLPGFFGYTHSITSKVLIPFALVLAMRHHQWLTAILLVSLSVLLFGLTSHKATLFYPFVVMLVYLISRHHHIVHYFIFGLIAVVAISAADLWLFLQGMDGLYGWFASLFVRRALLLPSLLNWYYIDYFSVVQQIYWAESKLTLGLIDSPHPLRAVNLIGAEYFGNKDTSANTGWIGSGYANAGLFGVVIYSILIGILLAFLDTYARRLGTQVVTSIFIIPIFTILAMSDFTTSLLTHGLLLALLALILLKVKPSRHR